jgi:hypothetical protein
LRTFKLPSTIKTIGEGCFANCAQLALIDISQTLITSIPKHCFEKCVQLQVCDINQNKVRTYDEHCFRDCEKFFSIDESGAALAFNKPCEFMPYSFYNVNGFANTSFTNSTQANPYTFQANSFGGIKNEKFQVFTLPDYAKLEGDPFAGSGEIKINLSA